MALQIGIVGLPNVGKSTLFKALTKKQAEVANYPFCTIDPNVGVVKVPDERLDALARVSKSAKIIPTVIEFVDIAGLVAGASKGEGLGNKFLSHIREVDAIVHVVRNFTDPDVIHVEGRVNPNSDAETINLELILADQETAKKRVEKLERDTKGVPDKKLVQQLEAARKVYTALEAGKLANTVSLSDDERELVRDMNLLTMKPMMYVLNVDDDKKSAQKCDLASLHNCIEVSGRLEAELAELPEEEVGQYLAEMGIAETGLSKLIRAGYELLNLITFFTTGPEETRAWTVRRGARAPEAAGVIHTDFEKGFIRAEVINWKDLADAGGEVAAKEKGLLRLEGKEYEMQDGDVCHFRFSV